MTKSTGWLVGLSAFIFSYYVVYAQEFGLDNLEQGNVNLGNQPLIETVANIINIFLGVLGIIAVVLIIYAGYIWLTSQGNEEKITQAKKILSSAVIGLVIILASFGIATFIFNRLTGAINNNGDGGPGDSSLCPDGSLPPCLPTAGAQYLQTKRTYPGGTGVSLCSNVQVEFNQSVKRDQVNVNSFKIVKISDGEAFSGGQFFPSSDAAIISYRHLGQDFSPNTQYEVSLQGGSAGIVSVNSLRFKLDPGKTWQFTTGTQSDSQLPKVVTTEPAENKTEVCRETPIQIAFNEPMDAASFYGNVILREKDNPTSVMQLSQPSFGNNFQIVTFYAQTSGGQRLSLSASTQYEVILKSGPEGITDTCGNPLDGNSNGQADGSGDDYIWQFTTGLTLQCSPILSSVEPSATNYGQTVTLAGENLFLDGEVDFNGLLSGNNSFDNLENILCWNGQSHYPVGHSLRVACVDGQVKVRLPVGTDTGPAYDQDGLTAKGGRVSLRVGFSKSNELSFKSLSPYLDKVSPNQGASDQFISLQGYNFGDQPGVVKFWSGSNSWIAEAPGQCSNWWQETDITVKVPQGLPLGDYMLQLTTASTGTNSSNKPSNLENFTVNNNPVGPGICSLAPNQVAIEELPLAVKVTGERFGNQSIGNKLSFSDFLANKFSPEFYWQDDEIYTQTPVLGALNALAAGRHQVCVTSNGLKSNCKILQVSGAGQTVVKQPKVVEYTACLSGTQSPSPALNDLSCNNTLVSVRFTESMLASSLTVANIKLRVCGQADIFNQSDCQTEINWETIEILPSSQSGAEGFTAKSVANLQPGYWYQATIKQSVVSLVGLNLAEDYVWQWRVKPTGSCSLDKVLVSPSQAKISSLTTPNNTKDFIGQAVASNCNILSPSGYSWQWSSDNTTKATVTPLSNSFKSRATAKDWTAVDQPVMIKAKISSENKENQSRLYITDKDIDVGSDPDSTVLRLIKVEPLGSAQNVCRNAVVVATFNRPPLANEVKASDLVLKTGCNEDACPEIIETILGTTSLRGSRLIFTPKNNLLPPNSSHSSYQVFLPSGRFDCGTVNNCQWNFRVGQEVCQVDKVFIDPADHVYNKPGQGQEFYAQARDKEDVAVNASYKWTKSDAAGVVSLSGLVSEQSVVAVSGNKNGRAALQVIADASNQLAGQASTSALLEVYLCEVPWQSDDNKYNFRLRYCRSVTVNDSSAGLPELIKAGPLPGQGDLLNEYLLRIDGSEDVIGLRVYSNNNQLNPMDWYNNRSDIIKANPKLIGNLDDYSAIQDGNSVYVGAVNLTAGKAYSNIYVLSYNKSAGQSMTQIFNELINNWQFNINLSSTDSISKLKRDYQRLTDLRTIRTALEDYYQAKGSYPVLSAGTYLTGRTVSAWPSWQSELGNVLGAGLPVDPKNKLVDCGSGYNANTCWNEVIKNFKCSLGSHVYQYIYNGQGGLTGYSLLANFEYKNIIWSLSSGEVTISNNDNCDSYKYNSTSQNIKIDPKQLEAVE
ncbi:Ig-like domain-containing protein [Patescibacteria group bacterium]|nr:Ig-like domain-containing protein [Patescibacteria group bacterium]